MVRPLALSIAGALLACTCFLGFAGCSNLGLPDGGCDSSDTGPCTGTFPCGNSGIQEACDKATQVCVLHPGMVNCITVPGASASACPTPDAAKSMAGCTTGLQETCSGSASEGITITCD
jgi:hypothetical protein